MHFFFVSFRKILWRKSMKDINLVLRNKRVQFAELALEIEGLETAAAALRPVAHLLSEDDSTQSTAAAQLSLADNPPEAAVAESTRAAIPDRSRIRRWV
jgi:hypothetical protein